MDSRRLLWAFVGALMVICSAWMGHVGISVNHVRVCHDMCRITQVCRNHLDYCGSCESADLSEEYCADTMDWATYEQDRFGYLPE